MSDVAREAGVSVATVSRVLAGAGYPVRAETRRRVLDAAARLRYRPNGLGRSLRVGRSSAIGLCATTLNNPTAVAAVEGIIRACRAAHRHVQTTTTFADPAEEQGYLDLFLQERVAGVISFPSGAPAEAYQRLQRMGAPVVLLNRAVPGLAAPLVRHDFAGGYVLAVDWLTARGHRRIGAILPVNMSAWGDHLVAWDAAFERLGCEPAPDLVRQLPSSPTVEQMHRAVADLLASGHPPTALFTATIMSTLTALRLIETPGRSEFGRVAIVGTGDRRWELLFPPAVPFVCLDSYGLGTTAAEILNDSIDNGSDEYADCDVIIPVQMVDAALAPSIERA
ncbi:MAG: LacI family DNA-binding transcriptional regulator [Chloroflexi bacterium]|nr:LacI family DNA-binding transcriptional regulator [Chloroflexota bacterium]